LFSGFTGIGIHHRTRAQRERRHVDGLIAAAFVPCSIGKDAACRVSTSWSASDVLMSQATPIRKARISIVPADNPVRIEAVRQLFQEYAASLSFNLCFQSFEEELARLPGEYAPLPGMLLLGLVDDQVAGCVAFHRLEGEMAGRHGEGGGVADICEMKRLYVRPEFRRCGLGKELIDSILNCAAAVGYRWIRLDTVPTE